MIPDLKILSPVSVTEAVKLLAENKPGVKIIAGGTDIIPGFHISSKRFTDIELLVDLGGIDELKTISESENQVTIGAACTFSEISKSDIIKSNFPLLSDSARSIGNPQIRNRATIAGNFINNASCADSVPPLLVYDAVLEIASSNGVRKSSLETILLNPYKTSVLQNEIVTKIIIAKQEKNYQKVFYKLGRRKAVAISRITLAILLFFESGKIKDLKIASGAITPIGMRFRDKENNFIGKIASEETFKKLANNIGKKIIDVTGLRWSSQYKVTVVQQMIYQLLEKLYKQHKNAGNNE